MPHALLLSDANVVGFDPSRPQPFADGWQEVTPEHFAAAQSTPRPQLIDGEIVSGPEPEPAAPMPVRWSKLKVIDALNAIGMLPGLLGYLDADPVRRLRFDAAQVIMSDDPMVPVAIPVIAQMSGKTEAEIQAILDTCQDC